MNLCSDSNGSYQASAAGNAVRIWADTTLTVELRGLGSGPHGQLQRTKSDRTRAASAWSLRGGTVWCTSSFNAGRHDAMEPLYGGTVRTAASALDSCGRRRRRGPHRYAAGIATARRVATASAADTDTRSRGCATREGRGRRRCLRAVCSGLAGHVTRAGAGDGERLDGCGCTSTLGACGISCRRCPGRKCGRTRAGTDATVP
jgi:hypothetical protein